MRKFPTRPIQHVQEDKSFAILRYKLQDIGIFRDQTVSDYGIDFEFELTKGSELTGKILKIQVKSSENIQFNEDGTISVGGIKQSTLIYWAEISFSLPVILAVVDTATEDIFLSSPIFWNCIECIDDNGSTKTLRFPVRQPKGEENQNHAIASLILNSFLPSVKDELSKIAHAMKCFRDYCTLYESIHHYDLHMPIEEVDVLDDLLEICSSLNIERVVHPYGEKLEEEELNNLYKKRWWCERMEFKYYGHLEGPPNITMQKPLQFLLPRLLKRIKIHINRIVKSGYYWKARTPSTIARVFSWKYTGAKSLTDIEDIGCDNFKSDNTTPNIDFYKYIQALENGDQIDQFILSDEWNEGPASRWFID